MKTASTKTKLSDCKTIKHPKTQRDLEAEEDRKILYNAAILRAMPDDIAGALMKAKTKPIWCSDVRWRMELARRRRKFNI